MLALVESGGANFASILFAVEPFGVKTILTNDPDRIAAADHVILPGVGSVNAAQKACTTPYLKECLTTLTQPVLGICLGMQLLCSHSEEGSGNLLGLFQETVCKFPRIKALPVPHMGWNTIASFKSSPLLRGVEEQSFVCYANSYYVPLCDGTIAQTIYGSPFSAMIARDNFFGCQFHPERSGAVGRQILRNFLAL